MPEAKRYPTSQVCKVPDKRTKTLEHSLVLVLEKVNLCSLKNLGVIGLHVLNLQSILFLILVIACTTYANTSHKAASANLSFTLLASSNSIMRM